MSIIWIFGEARSGSTAFSKKVASHLNRQYFDADTPKLHETALSIENPNKYVFFTHSFFLLERMNVYNSSDLILFRCSRKNKLEQCLSHLMTSWVTKMCNDKKLWNVSTDDNIDEKLKLFETTSPTIITKKQVLGYLNQLTVKERYWANFASKYQNTTIFYEDLCTLGVTVPFINLSYKLIDAADTIKLPPYKERLCLNYDMVKRWIEEYYDAQVVELADTQR